MCCVVQITLLSTITGDKNSLKSSPSINGSFETNKKVLPLFFLTQFACDSVKSNNSFELADNITGSSKAVKNLLVLIAEFLKSDKSTS